MPLTIIVRLLRLGELGGEGAVLAAIGVWTRVRRVGTRADQANKAPARTMIPPDPIATGQEAGRNGLILLARADSPVLVVAAGGGVRGRSLPNQLRGSKETGSALVSPPGIAGRMLQERGSKDGS
jgi:hypothetical protein